MLRYIELKTGYNDDGPAWIGHVDLSRSGRTIYFNGKAFKRTTMGASANYFDVETSELYWISGVKRDGRDRHPAGGGKVVIERAALAEYLALVGASELDLARFVVSDAIKPTDPRGFTIWRIPIRTRESHRFVASAVDWRHCSLMFEPPRSPRSHHAVPAFATKKR